MIYKYCRKCGKRLKDEESRARGFGKTCFARQGQGQGKAVLVPSQKTLFEELEKAESKASKGKASRATQTLGKAGARARQGKPKVLEKKKIFSEGQGRDKLVEPSLLEKTLTLPRQKTLLFKPRDPTPVPRETKTTPAGNA